MFTYGRGRVTIFLLVFKGRVRIFWKPCLKILVALPSPFPPLNNDTSFKTSVYMHFTGHWKCRPVGRGGAHEPPPQEPKRSA